MKTFIVFAKVTSYMYTHVDAETPEQAMSIAEDFDGREFNDCPDPEWEIVEAVETT